MTEQTIKRKRGRPRKDARPSFISYAGPSLDQVYALSDEHVVQALKELGVEPDALRWSDDNPHLNLARWGQSEDDREDDIERMAELKAQAIEYQQTCNKSKLFSAYLQRWIDSLSDSELISTLQRLSGETLSESALRYADKGKLHHDVFQLVYAECAKASQGGHMQ